MEPLDFNAIYKTLLDFQFNQFNPQFALQLLIISKLPIKKSINPTILSSPIQFASWTLTCNFDPKSVLNFGISSIKSLIALID